MVVARPDAEVCRVCGGAAHAGFAHCFCCATLVRQLQMPLVPVVAVAEYRVGDRLHRRLRGYKDAPVAEARETCAAHLADLVAAVDGGQPDPAPPTLRLRVGPGGDGAVLRPAGGRPADALVLRVPALALRHRTLLVRGPEPTGHLRAARRGFEVAASVDRESLRDRRVLVFDDSITTGARAQSAAAALRMAGADVVGVVAVGRVVGGGRWAARRVLG